MLEENQKILLTGMSELVFYLKRDMEELKSINESLKKKIAIKDDVMKYAETISQILNIDVEVMDKNLTRIAGTGRIKEKVGLSMSEEAHVYKKVLKTKETYIITNPRKEEICDSCPSKGTCGEVLEISTPIIFKSEAVGVIGLICFDEFQKREFLHKKESYIKFLKQMADFISSHVYQENEKIMIENNNQVLLNVVNGIPNAIIITNEDNKIELINDMGVNLFGNYEPGMYIRAEDINDMLDKKEFQLTCGNITHEVVGDILDFPTHMGRFRTLYVFQESEKFKKYLHQFNSGYAKIFIFNSPQMQNVYSKIQRVAKTTTTILITGESGTGKEVAARAVHENSNRADKPFIPVNCGAIPENLMESEFFGYVKGAFTGANPKGKIGYFEQADGGTIFLDEIGDMPLSLQVKLLRVLQEKTITPIGAGKGKKIDIRIIAATNKDLEELVKENKFREDLYYRLNVFPVDIPPLRNRPKDIEELAEYFIVKYSQLFNTPLKTFSNEVMKAFTSYSWPGNIRELKNVVEYIINVVDERDPFISLKHLPPRFVNSSEKYEIKTLAEMEKDAIKTLMQRFGTSSKDKVKIAETLDISLATLYRKIKQYNLEK